MQGTIRYWNEDRGFGFIKPDAPSELDVFLHISTVERSGFDIPKMGDRFDYEIETNRDGRTRACNLRKA